MELSFMASTVELGGTFGICHNKITLYKEIISVLITTAAIIKN